MTTELDWLRQLEQDVQTLRGYTDKVQQQLLVGYAVTANNLATSLKVKINNRIIELLEASQP